jgi:acyl-CoA synthetase (AMP-forming)/AMP-acid ligase II
MFVATVVEKAAAQWPRRVALVDGEIRISFSQLRDRVGRLANALLGLGLQPGDRVLDIQKNGHQYVETDLAFAVAGLVRVAINTRLNLTEWKYIANISGARGIVYSAAFSDEVAELSAESGATILVRIGGDGPGVDYEELLGGASTVFPHRWSTPSDIVSLNFSSGTTGKPKGCIRTIANRLASTQDMLGSVFNGELNAADVFLHAGPLTHASGLFVLPHLCVGATQVIMRRFDEGDVRKLMRNSLITGTVLVPTMLQRVVDAYPHGHLDLPRLRHLAYAGAPMPAERIAEIDERLPGRLVQFYGLVEAIPPLTVLGPADHPHSERVRSAGRPVLGADIAIVGKDGVRLAAGEHGELVIGGPHVMSGYWADEEATVKSVDGGWLRTGDIAVADEDGYVYLVDRKADMIITGGFNVMPREIELSLHQAPGVHEAAVVGVPDRTWGEAIAAFVVPKPGSVLDKETLLAHCAQHLSSYKKPKRIEFVEELPKGATGKVSRAELRRRLTHDGLPR